MEDLVDIGIEFTKRPLTPVRPPTIMEIPTSSAITKLPSTSTPLSSGKPTLTPELLLSQMAIALDDDSNPLTKSFGRVIRRNVQDDLDKLNLKQSTMETKLFLLDQKINKLEDKVERQSTIINERSTIDIHEAQINQLVATSTRLEDICEKQVKHNSQLSIILQDIFDRHETIDQYMVDVTCSE